MAKKLMVRVFDPYTRCCYTNINNDTICCVLSSGQLVIAIAALAQHIVSMVKFDRIFFCMANQTKLEEGMRTQFLEADVIIFDFGLFNELLNMNQCIANYLDGGYMRALWCLGQIVAILLLFLLQFKHQPHHLLLAPIMLMENIYVLGLLVLTLATLNPLVTTILYKLDFTRGLRVGAYLSGVIFNFFLDYVLWHYYWYLEKCNKVGWVAPLPV